MTGQRCHFARLMNEDNPKNSERGGSKRNRPRKPESYLPEMLRALPHSIDAEKGVLGSILLSPISVLDECITKKITSKHFYLPAHGMVFSTLLEMQEKHLPIDLISLTQFLDDTHQLADAGGASGVTDLFTFLPTSANADYYMEIVREKFLLRQVIKVCTEATARAYDEQGEVPRLLNEVESKVLSIGRDRASHSSRGIKELAISALDSVENLIKNRGALTGLPTGFKELDRLTNGLQPGEMIVIAARPSMGKTALAMNIAEHAAIVAGKTVAVYSLEMRAEQLALRLLCALAKVGVDTIRNGFLDKIQMNSLIQATNSIAKSKLFIDDTPSLEVLEFQANARRLHREHGLDLIVVDYLQLMRSPSRRGQENRQIEVAEISSGIKALAKELEIPVIVLAQLNRNPDNRTGNAKGKPKLSDLRESGSIEQDADIVGLIWREHYYLEEEEKKEKEDDDGKSALLIEKHRNGATGLIPLTFHRTIARFEDREQEEPHG